MAYKALEDFKEKYDNNRIYKKDERYPAEGFEPGEERIRELSTDRNYFNRPFIVEVETPDGAEARDVEETEKVEKVLSESEDGKEETKTKAKSKAKGKEDKEKVADKNAKDKG